MWKVKHLQHSSSISFVQESRSVQSKLLGLERTERLILRILLFLLEANWVITEELGMNLDNVELDMLGSCKEEALDTGNFSRIRILMRFLTVLMCSKVVQPSSLLVVFETLLSSAATTVDEEKGNPSWQACADFYITCILSCLPWGGSELVEIQYFLAALKALSRKEIHYGAYATSEQLKPDARGPVLCFVGPPGVGKTSLASSIAAALGRKFVRISLGGMKDEADIRGHWRTYIRSMPGRLIDVLKRVAVCNPVMLLDEIDKTGSDVRGDPASALLEVLDPEQNKRFNDQYPISFRIFLSLRFFYINLIRVR